MPQRCGLVVLAQSAGCHERVTVAGSPCGDTASAFRSRGSTTVNSAIAWRAPEAVLRDWSQRFGLGDAVSVEALAPHYEALESIAQLIEWAERPAR